MILTILIILALLVFFVIGLYNRLVKLRNNRENAFSDIDVQLKQRLDLIPQLVESVKAYMKHESSVLTDITNARANAIKATGINEKIAAESQLSSALQGLRVAVEAYPDLKANQNFLQLQDEISDIENKLAAARRFFNSATKELNNAVETFPSNLLAGMFGFKREPMFDLGPDHRVKSEETPKLNF
jgi:LemA protein